MPSQDTVSPSSRQFAPRSRRRRYSFEGEVLDAVQETIASNPHWSPAQIWKDLNSQAAIKDRLPSQRTVNRLMAESAAKGSTAWQLEDDPDGNDAALVLPVLAAVIERTEQQVLRLTHDEVRWIVRLRRAAPDIPLWASYYLARRYLERQASGLPTDNFDRIVAAAPWRHPERQQRYTAATIILIGPAMLSELTDKVGMEDRADG